MGSEAEYVDPEYRPDGFTFKEPSKLSKIEAYAGLKFWYDRQQDPKVKKVFQFRRIRGKNGEPELPDLGRKEKKSNRKSRADGLKKKGGRKAPGSQIGRPAGVQSSETEEEEEEEEEREQSEQSDEENEGTGDEGHPPPQKRNLPQVKAPKSLPFAAVRVKPQGAGSKNKAIAGKRSRDGDGAARGVRKRPAVRAKVGADVGADAGTDTKAGAGGGGKEAGRGVGMRPVAGENVGASIGADAGSGTDDGVTNEGPQTRQQKRKALQEEDTGPRKKSRQAKEVTKVGPPRGQKKDKPSQGRSRGPAKK